MKDALLGLYTNFYAQVFCELRNLHSCNPTPQPPSIFDMISSLFVISAVNGIQYLFAVHWK